MKGRNGNLGLTAVLQVETEIRPTLHDESRPEALGSGFGVGMKGGPPPDGLAARGFALREWNEIQCV